MLVETAVVAGFLYVRNGLINNRSALMKDIIKALPEVKITPDTKTPLSELDNVIVSCKPSVKSPYIEIYRNYFNKPFWLFPAVYKGNNDKIQISGMFASNPRYYPSSLDSIIKYPVPITSFPNEIQETLNPSATYTAFRCEGDANLPLYYHGKMVGEVYVYDKFSRDPNKLREAIAEKQTNEYDAYEFITTTGIACSVIWWFGQLFQNFI